MSGSIGDDLTLINTASEFVQAKTVAAETLFERSQIKLSQVTYCLNPHFGTACLL
jgi:hypothetical protein